MARSGYFGKTFIRNIGRMVVWKIHFRLPSFAKSSSWSSCRTGKVDSPGLKIYGLRIHIFAVRRSLALGKQLLNSCKRTRKWLFTRSENACSGSLSFKVSANIWNMSNTALFTRCSHNFKLVFKCSHFICQLEVELSFCLEVKDLVCWADGRCHTSTQV